MIIVHVLLALVFAAILGTLLTAGMGRRGPGPWSGLLFFAALIFLWTWAGGLWLVPIGPPLWGTPWLGFAFMAILLMLIVAAVTPSSRTRGSDGALTRTEEKAEVREAVGITLGGFFYLAAIFLLAAIVFGYLLS